MRSEAAAFNLFGLNVYTSSLFLGFACILSGILVIFRSQNSETQKNAAALSCLLSPILGLAFSRAVFVLFEVNFAPFLSFKNVFNLHTGGLSMFGALIGTVLGAVIAAKVSRIKVLNWLDLLIPSVFLFIAAARLGEGFTTLGISRPLVTDVLKNTFLAFHDEYDAYLRTFLLEGFTAAILSVLSILYHMKHKKSGYTLIYGALMFGTTQTLFESLRFDAHLRFSFIGLQQLLSVLLFTGVLLYLSIQSIRQKKHTALAVLTLCLIPLVLAAILGIEFMIDRSQINKWFSYLMYVLVLAVPTTLGLVLLEKKRGTNG